MDPRNISTTGEGRGTLNGVRVARWPDTTRSRTRHFDAHDDAAIDATSRLVWMRCSVGQSWDGSTCTGYIRRFDFQAAMAFAQEQAARTGQAWRVPNAKELASLVDPTRKHPAIDPVAFPNTLPDLYWTSTAYAWTATGGWAVTFDGGQTLAYYDGYQLALRLVHDAK